MSKPRLGYRKWLPQPPIVVADEAAWTFKIVEIKVPVAVFVAWVALELLLLGSVVGSFVWVRAIDSEVDRQEASLSVVLNEAIDAAQRASDAQTVANEANRKASGALPWPK